MLFVIIGREGQTESVNSMKTFEPKLLQTIRTYSKKQLVNDLVAGVIVAIIALPLSIALAIASGVSPEKGLYTAIVAGFVIALLGGSRVNISGPTAAFATIVAGIVAEFGMSGLVTATIMAGLILIIMGLCKVGSLIKYIPYTITTGFTSGIAVTIVIGQLKDFFGLTYPQGTNAVETMEKLKAVVASISTINWQSLLLGAVSLAILIVWPKISKKIPGSLVVVLIGIVLVKGLNMQVNTIGDLYTISCDLPTPSLPAFDLATLKQLLPSAFTIAVLAGIESLLSCVVSDGMIEDRHNSNTELIAQGVGNIFSGVFGGIPATGAIARTAANVKNGGRTPIAGMVHAVVLLLVLVALMPYAAWIPMPVIAAILFMVAYNMSEWRQFVSICKSAPKSDIAVLVLTFVMTVVFDLVVAIEIGLLLTMVLLLKRMSDVTEVHSWKDASKADDRLKNIPPHTRVFEINGPLFFATTDRLANISAEEDVRVVILRMRNIPMLDISALRSLRQVYTELRGKNIQVLFSHVNEQPMLVMRKSGFFDEVGAGYFPANIDEALDQAGQLAE